VKEDAFDRAERSADPVIRANKRVRAAVIAIWIVSVLTGAAAIRFIDENTTNSMR
jgi:hypothetical protein